LWTIITACETSASEGPLLDRGSELSSFSVDTIRSGSYYSARDYLDAQERRNELSRMWDHFFENFDLIITPGQNLLPFLHAESDRLHARPENWSIDLTANLTGQPAIVVPCGVTAMGLPVAVQLMGRRYSDLGLLRVAATLERYVSLPTPPLPFGRGYLS
jgi:Asp-tRNA(Asn)/Glu-tRNA(Gln) amidotransferase A subunit family amidase